jgi:hypothetical protein
MRLGWRKAKFDARDYLHKDRVVSGFKIPTTFSLAQFCPTVRDQGNVGSCTGFGIGGTLTGLAKQQNVYKEWFSPEWIYNGARFIEGTLTQDAGADPSDCMSWIKQKGCLLEEFWPYNPNALDTTSPPSKDNPLATQYPILTYVRVTGGSAGICSALASGNLVSIGTPWFDAWMSIGSTGVLPKVTTSSSVAGGHETFLFGYDQTTNQFFGQNSWGTGWGKAGTYLMPFAVFDGVFNSLGGYDAYYVTVSWGSTPTPTPAPPPTPAPIPPPPTPPMLVVVMVAPANPKVIAGSTQKFSANGLYADGSTKDITASVAWSSSNVTVSTVKSSGLATAVAHGSSNIIATLSGISGHTVITVSVPPTPPVPPAPPTPPVVDYRMRLLGSKDGGKTWAIMYEGDLKAVVSKVKLSDSKDNGKNWTIMYEGDLK